MQGQQVGWQVSPRLTTYRRGLGSRKDHHSIGAVFCMEAIPLRIKPLQVLEILRAVIRHPASEKTTSLFAEESDELGLALVHLKELDVDHRAAEFGNPRHLGVFGAGQIDEDLCPRFLHVLLQQLVNLITPELIKVLARIGLQGLSLIHI